MNNEYQTLLSSAFDFLYPRAIKLCGVKEDAEDLIQSVLLRAIKKEKLFDGANFYGWITVVLLNEFRNRCKQTKNVPSYEIMGDIEYSHSENDRTYHIMELVGMLPDTLKTVLTYRIDGYDYAEIAKLTEVPLGTVKTRILRARKELGNLLKQNI